MAMRRCIQAYTDTTVLADRPETLAQGCKAIGFTCSPKNAFRFGDSRNRLNGLSQIGTDLKPGITGIPPTGRNGFA